VASGVIVTMQGGSLTSNVASINSGALDADSAAVVSVSGTSLVGNHAVKYGVW
jgi:hypothetical protein